ncbi:MULTISPECIES: hypothetical protein [unclassified Candidatus Cardinium]|uniref:hypothetical protein n=1 Tax=unclassified Candidatus Cardinium TaxID=2641185 RepID=UPI001FB4CC2D|nr:MULTISPECIES: hypothetical protein [unclassified Candidatus Cardinium]
MECTNPFKRNTTSFLLKAICSFIFCLFTNYDEGIAKEILSSDSIITLQKITKFCKQSLSKISKENNLFAYFDHQKTYHLQQPEVEASAKRSTQQNQANDSTSRAILNQTLLQPIEPADDDQKSVTILDEYEKIKNFYAYDPIGQTWVRIKSFKVITESLGNKPIDLKRYGKPYMNFWAYDVSNQTWHKVSLISYLQQTNTQINNHSPATAIQESAPTDRSNQFSDLATDELLEELLGVHTLAKQPNLDQKESPWANLSLDFTIGPGAVFYTNYLEEMHLLQRENNEYFFKTNTDEIYQPNWFYDTLSRYKLADFNLSDPRITQGSAENATFKGKGWAIPITLGIQYTLWKRLLVGIGREIVFNATNQLVHNDETIDHKEYIPNKKWSTQGRWFAKLGWYPFNNENYRFFTDIRIFRVHHLDTVLPNLVGFGDYIHQALAYNFGLGYEQQLTNYLACTTRLAMELQKFKQFSNDTPHNYNIHYKQPAIYLQLGLAIRFAKYKSSNDLTNQDYQNNNRKPNDLSKVEGLQDLLDLD